MTIFSFFEIVSRLPLYGGDLENGENLMNSHSNNILAMAKYILVSRETQKLTKKKIKRGSVRHPQLKNFNVFKGYSGKSERKTWAQLFNLKLGKIMDIIFLVFV